MMTLDSYLKNKYPSKKVIQDRNIKIAYELGKGVKQKVIADMLGVSLNVVSSVKGIINEQN